ncbi:P0 [Mallotus japonicus virus A]|uniref:P0 n=1 Tax=Mallotus japonicus virus A TaxID=2977935 RepID=A0AAE9NVQ9_9VIRU|nr:P0 [Mallotus japonicus virus A]
MVFSEIVATRLGIALFYHNTTELAQPYLALFNFLNILVNFERFKTAYYRHYNYNLNENVFRRSLLYILPLVLSDRVKCARNGIISFPREWIGWLARWGLALGHTPFIVPHSTRAARVHLVVQSDCDTYEQHLWPTRINPLAERVRANQEWLSQGSRIFNRILGAELMRVEREIRTIRISDRQVRDLFLDLVRNYDRLRALSAAHSILSPEFRNCFSGSFRLLRASLDIFAIFTFSEGLHIPSMVDYEDLFQDSIVLNTLLSQSY